MSKFYVELSKLDKDSKRISSNVSQAVNTAKITVGNVKSGLGGIGLGQLTVSLDAIEQKLGKNVTNCNNLSTTLSKIIADYKQTENTIIAGGAGSGANNGNTPGYAGNKGGTPDKTNTPTKKDEDYPDGTISDDYKYIYLDGKKYEIYDSFQEYNNITGPSFDVPHDWQTVETKSISETTWDWWGAIANLNNMSSDDYAAATVDNQSTLLGGLDSMFSIAKIAADARNDVNVEFNFQEDQYGNRRVIIGVTNSDYQQWYNDMAGSRTSRLDVCQDGAAKMFWSNAIADYYTQETGNPTNNFHDYDVITTIDEGHSGQKYTSTISFNEDGSMSESILILPGDTCVIQERSGFLNLHTEDIYTIDLKERATSEIPQQYSDLILQCLEEGF